VSLADLQMRGLARIRFRRPLRLVDLTGPGLHRLQADARLTTGDYAVAQRWSQALLRHPDGRDGILYRSRHDPPRLCAALFERAEDVLDTVDLLGRLDEPGAAELVAGAIEMYGYQLVD
jgi:hypothetical protein